MGFFSQTQGASLGASLSAESCGTQLFPMLASQCTATAHSGGSWCKPSIHEKLGCKQSRQLFGKELLENLGGKLPYLLPFKVLQFQNELHNMDSQNGCAAHSWSKSRSLLSGDHFSISNLIRVFVFSKLISLWNHENSQKLHRPKNLLGM